MTHQAGIDPHRLAADMTVGTAGLIGRMQYIADQPLALAAVRIMTRTAIGRWNGKTGMFLAHRGTGMTLQAQIIAPIDQQIRVLRLVRQMTGGAIPAGVWCMGIFIAARYLIMAAEAGLSKLSGQQTLVI